MIMEKQLFENPLLYKFFLNWIQTHIQQLHIKWEGGLNLKISKASRALVISLVGIFIVFTTNCGSNKSMTFNLQHRQILNGIPSASGIVQIENVLYVIGDNSAWLYQLDALYEVKQKYTLLENSTDSILSKASKPDFEAMTSFEIDNEMNLLIFGSGSKSPERDVLVRVQFKDSIRSKVYDLGILYDSLRNSKYLNSESLNIEAAATIGNTLYLFNREHNLVFEYVLDEILGFLEGQNELPLHKIVLINLPKINGLSAKFSGASAIEDSHQLVFTASVENTPNTYDDGEIVGSYVGVINIEDLKDGYQSPCVLIRNDLKNLPIKVESVEVLEVIDINTLKLALVTDSDGGESELLIGNLTW